MSIGSKFKKKRFIIPAILILLLLVLRLYLPSLALNYINKTLADIPGYFGQVEDIDISLLKGAYVIHGININKVEAQSQVPFVKVDKTNISLEWKSLFKGRIVSEIIMDSPTIIYVFEDHEEGLKSTLDDWTEILTDLNPISINNLKVRKGKFAFVQVVPDPTLDLNIDDVTLEATNLQNVRDTDVKLPSKLSVSGRSIGNGELNIDGEMNILKLIPDMNISLSLENAEAVSLNNMVRHYANIEFLKGQFSLYSELAISEGYLKSYVKPLLSETEIKSPEKKFLFKIWEGFLGFFNFVLKNQKNNNIATKIPIEGDLSDSSVGVWCTVFNLFKNAWFEAYKSETDGSIEFSDAERRTEDM